MCEGDDDYAYYTVVGVCCLYLAVGVDKVVGVLVVGRGKNFRLLMMMMLLSLRMKMRLRKMVSC